MNTCYILLVKLLHNLAAVLKCRSYWYCIFFIGLTHCVDQWYKAINYLFAPSLGVKVWPTLTLSVCYYFQHPHHCMKQQQQQPPS